MIVLGIDLAQQRDRTALVALSSYNAPPEGEAKRKRSVRHYDVLHVSTLRPNTPYAEQVTAIISVAHSLATDERATLFVDQTGVGRPVVDMLRDACPYPVRGITITAGGDVTPHGKDLSVAKSTLIGGLSVALNLRRFHCPADLPGADDLRAELGAYAFEMSDAGRPIYGGKGSHHDDLVIAAALAVFGAEKGGALANFREFMAEEIQRRQGPEIAGEQP